jgi:hypothetical protein
MPLVSTPAHGLKTQLPQDLIHPDLSAQFGEVNTWHGLCSRDVLE